MAKVNFPTFSEITGDDLYMKIIPTDEFRSVWVKKVVRHGDMVTLYDARDNALISVPANETSHIGNNCIFYSTYAEMNQDSPKYQDEHGYIRVIRYRNGEEFWSGEYSF